MWLGGILSERSITGLIIMNSGGKKLCTAGFCSRATADVAIVDAPTSIKNYCMTFAIMEFFVSYISLSNTTNTEKCIETYCGQH